MPAFNRGPWPAQDALVTQAPQAERRTPARGPAPWCPRTMMDHEPAGRKDRRVIHRAYHLDMAGLEGRAEVDGAGAHRARSPTARRPR